MNLSDDPITVMYAESMVAANRAVFDAPTIDGPEFDALRAIEWEAMSAGVFVTAYALRRRIERDQ